MEQFTPLAAELELRVGELMFCYKLGEGITFFCTGVPQSFRVDVTPTENYPLDIYILMDFSNSMFTYIQNLRDVSLALGN